MEQEIETIKHDVEVILERLGGSAAVNRMFRVSNAAVQQWKVNGLPKARWLHLLETRPEVLEGTRYAESANQGA